MHNLFGIVKKKTELEDTIYGNNTNFNRFHWRNMESAVFATIP